MYIGNQPYQVAFVTDTFNGTGSATAFTMSVAPANTASVLVAVSGVLQDPSTYSVSGTTLTFSAAPPSGTGNISCRYLGIPASGVTTTAYRTVTEFTATAGQTTFTPPSYTAGFINVYRNGVLLGTADYTATNGTTVVLAKSANSGDLVTVESFLVSSVLNAIPATAGSVGSTYLASSLSLTTPTLTSPTISGNANMTGGTKYQVSGVTTNALAWVNFAGGTGTVTSGYNVSSVTRNSTGNYTINFTNALSDANYVITGMLSDSFVLGSSGIGVIVSRSTTKTTSAAGVSAGYSASGIMTAVDYSALLVTIHGN